MSGHAWTSADEVWLRNHFKDYEDASEKWCNAGSFDDPDGARAEADADMAHALKAVRDRIVAPEMATRIERLEAALMLETAAHEKACEQVERLERDRDALLTEAKRVALRAGFAGSSLKDLQAAITQAEAE